MSAERRQNQISMSDLQNPLFLHPTEGPASLGAIAKLIGAENYRGWKRAMEIKLSTKRKLGFVAGTIPRPQDPITAEQWDTCNNTMISWILYAVSEPISQSILYMQSASEIWSQLERRFSLSNGSRKYQINKEIYDLKHGERSISDFYTKLRCLWEENDAKSSLPRFTTVNSEITKFLKALSTQ